MFFNAFHYVFTPSPHRIRLLSTAKQNLRRNHVNIQPSHKGRLTRYVTILKLAVWIWWRTLSLLNLVNKRGKKRKSVIPAIQQTDVSAPAVEESRCSYRGWSRWGRAEWSWTGWCNIASARLWSSRGRRRRWTVAGSRCSSPPRPQFVSLCFPKRNKHIHFPLLFRFPLFLQIAEWQKSHSCSAVLSAAWGWQHPGDCGLASYALKRLSRTIYTLKLSARLKHLL